MTQSESTSARRDRLSCIDSNNSWRRQAASVREHAASASDPAIRDRLTKSADSCDEQANWWLAGAIDDQVARA